MINRTYQFACSAINSKPDVSLVLYDTNSMKSLSTGLNSATLDTCDSILRLCTVILQVNFQFQDNTFDNMTSLTCSANSSDPDVPSYTNTSRNVKIQTPGLYF